MKFLNTHVAIVENPNNTLQLKLGRSTQSISYFESGTGIATGYNGVYDTIFITNTGHHYLTYEDENGYCIYSKD